MQLGMVGLGRMGGNMTVRLTKAGHDVKTFDPKVDSTSSSLEELAIPDQPFGFAQLIRAQAAGDLQSLKERGRRVARVRLEDL